MITATATEIQNNLIDAKAVKVFIMECREQMLSRFMCRLIEKNRVGMGNCPVSARYMRW